MLLSDVQFTAILRIYLTFKFSCIVYCIHREPSLSVIFQHSMPSASRMSQAVKSKVIKKDHYKPAKQGLSYLPVHPTWANEFFSTWRKFQEYKSFVTVFIRGWHCKGHSHVITASYSALSEGALSKVFTHHSIPHHENIPPKGILWSSNFKKGYIHHS